MKPPSTPKSKSLSIRTDVYEKTYTAPLGADDTNYMYRHSQPSILNSRDNQNRDTTTCTSIRNLDTKNYKEVPVLQQLKSDKKKAGTTQLHSAHKNLDKTGNQRLKNANTSLARIEVTRRTLEKQLNSPPGDHFFIATTNDGVGINGCKYNHQQHRHVRPRRHPPMVPWRKGLIDVPLLPNART